MSIPQRIERALEAAIAGCEARGGPPRLGAAMRHAVFPGGARVRPQLCLAVAAACGDDVPPLADAAAAAIELLHCASLVHDDLPCFDDAPMRRGLPSVHARYGERIAVLAGDGLIVLAFDVLAAACETQGMGATSPTSPSNAAGTAGGPSAAAGSLAVTCRRLPALLRVLAARVGVPFGIVAGQAWECEDWVALPDYQRAKTGSLFAAAAEMGALAAGGRPSRWREFGEHLGEAYQVADDIRDVAADAQWLGKPVGRDHKLGRPNAVAEMGMTAALAHFDSLLQRSAEAVPAGPGATGLRALLHAEAERLLPPALVGRCRAPEARSAA